MEYCKGRELFKQIIEEEKLTEMECKRIMEKLLRAINHCHYLNIIHSDLKPENIIYSPKGAVKVIDFGLSMKLKDACYEGFAGTPYYIAPEIIKDGAYTKACDMWSLGVIMHVMLTGYFPVGGHNITQIFENIKKFREPNFTLHAWHGISKNAKDLLKKLLDPDYNTRITADEALKHPWLASIRTSRSLNSAEIWEALKRYSDYSEVKKSILELMVKNATDSELKEYQEVFLELDKAKNGIITSEELEDALNGKECKVTRKEAEELVRKVNHKGEDFITYTELLASLIATEEFLQDRRINSVFELLKTERTNTIKSTANSLDTSMKA